MRKESEASAFGNPSENPSCLWTAGNTDAPGVNPSLADIALFCWVEFGAMVGQNMPDDAAHLKAWRDKVASMPSAIASADPKHGLAA